MSGLPDEIWRQILETGIQTSSLSFRDLCCISISCRRLHRLSYEESLWSRLLACDFPLTCPPRPQNPDRPSMSVPAKSAYRIRFEKGRERRIAARRRAVLREESVISESERMIKVVENRLREEADKMRAVSTELSNLHNVSQASVALNVWQPEIVTGRQKQIVQQCAVPIESRVRALEMELSLCRKQMARLDKAYRTEKEMLETAKEELASLKYNPLGYYYGCSSSQDKNCNRNKLKKSVDFLEKDTEQSPKE